MNDDPEMLDEYDFSHARRGSITPTASGKTRITIRIDSDILNWFRDQVEANGGGSYQAMINLALREHIEAKDRNWTELFRQIVREELHAAGIGAEL